MSGSVVAHLRVLVLDRLQSDLAASVLREGERQENKREYKASSNGTQDVCCMKMF